MESRAMRKYTRDEHHQAIMQAIGDNCVAKVSFGEKVKFALQEGLKRNDWVIYFPSSQGFREKSESSSGTPPIIWLGQRLGFSGDHAHIYSRFMEVYGPERSTDSTPVVVAPRQALTPKAPRPSLSQADVQEFYARTTARDSIDAWVWLSSRGIPLSVASTLDCGWWSSAAGVPCKKRNAKQIETYGPGIYELFHAHGPALITPMRDRAGVIGNALIRWPSCQVKTDRQRFLASGTGSTRDSERFPLMYGTPERALNADRLYVCEGMPDTYTVQALTYDQPDTVVIGAMCAAEMGILGTWLEGFRGKQIVIIPHANDRYADGMIAGVKLYNHLTQAGVSASVFDWQWVSEVFRLASPDDANDALQRLGWEAMRRVIGYFLT